MFENTLRKDLGDFSSIVCLKAIVTGLEDIMGIPAARGNLILAGRKRGKVIVNSLGLKQTDKPIEEWGSLIKEAIGKNGTRLCTIANIQQTENIITVDLLDTVCSAGEEQGSPRKLTFTLGAIQGAVEEVTGKRVKASQTASVLCGEAFDSIELVLI